MVRQISVYVDDWQYDELQEEDNKSLTVRKALDLYYKNSKEEKEMEFVNTFLHGKGSQSNSEGFKSYNISTKEGKRSFLNDFAVGTVVMEKSFLRQIKAEALGKYVRDVVEYYNSKGYLMFFSDTKDITKSLKNKLKGNRIVVDAKWLEKNDPELLDWITRSKYWGRGFEEMPDRSEAIIEIEFVEDTIKYCATFESHPEGRQSLNNQPTWGKDDWEDWDDIDILKKYYGKVI